MKKFSISYLTCLLVSSVIVNVLQYTQVPNFADSWGPIWVSIIMYIILGSIPVLIGCLLGEFCYKKIKRSHELKIGVPLFILLGISYNHLLFTWFNDREFLSFNLNAFLETGLPITLSSLVFYFVRRCVNSLFAT
ncbi:MULTISPECIES: hypothetical protein [Bacillus]|uniref:Group-specific protein n=1 Tax=Bacillus mycoides TaxID=1405 RepID=A0A3D9UK46_BACMY|nr:MULTISPECIES: hypothetical protein [Bacillus]RBP27972.1 hypothetical protein DET63_10547 [Bacillus sp. DB-2]REF25191.1 hypothetical protein DET55_12538 [Bacillus mycoides]